MVKAFDLNEIEIQSLNQHSTRLGLFEFKDEPGFRHSNIVFNPDKSVDYKRSTFKQLDNKCMGILRDTFPIIHRKLDNENSCFFSDSEESICGDNLFVQSTLDPNLYVSYFPLAGETLRPHRVYDAKRMLFIEPSSDNGKLFQTLRVKKFQYHVLICSTFYEQPDLGYSPKWIVDHTTSNHEINLKDNLMWFPHNLNIVVKTRNGVTKSTEYKGDVDKLIPLSILNLRASETSTEIKEVLELAPRRYYYDDYEDRIIRRKELKDDHLYYYLESSKIQNGTERFSLTDKNNKSHTRAQKTIMRAIYDLF